MVERLTLRTPHPEVRLSSLTRHVFFLRQRTLLHFVSLHPAPVVQRPISANRWLNFNLGLLFFCSKAFFRILFRILLRASNHQIVAKTN